MAKAEIERQPTVFEYEDYRVFLRETYTFQKARSRHYSFRNFSRRAGFTSPNFLKLVIDGKRNLSADSIAKFVLALRLSKAEGEFFCHLVQFNQARTASERAECAKLLLRSKGFQRVYPLKQAEYAYYAQWYYVPIRELVTLRDFREDPFWIANQLHPPIAPAEAAKALHDLERLGLLTRDSAGRLAQAQRTVTTENEVVSASVVDYHKEMLKKASDAIDSVPRAKRELSAACVPISTATAAKIKSMIQNLRQEILALAGGDDDPHVIYQINMQLYPLSSWSDGEKKE